MKAKGHLQVLDLRICVLFSHYFYYCFVVVKIFFIYFPKFARLFCPLSLGSSSISISQVVKIPHTKMPRVVTSQVYRRHELPECQDTLPQRNLWGLGLRQGSASPQTDFFKKALLNWGTMLLRGKGSGLCHLPKFPKYFHSKSHWDSKTLGSRLEILCEWAYSVNLMVLN